ncbi:MAG TPA: sensor histidine kinase, partial [Aquabacterium sp.]|nr:sensor histidine kinase [Aquabacterium sp.]
LRQLGPRVLIVFRNSGMWPMRNGDAVMLADPNEAEKQAEPGKRENRPAAPPPAAKDLIGLHLCQCIIGLHGGQLREEDEDGLRNFLIDLPTGAPYRSDDAAMDAAQAQRYAADLATLMARRRQKAA